MSEIQLGKWYISPRGDTCIAEAITPVGVRILVNNNRIQIIDEKVFVSNWNLIPEGSYEEPQIPVPKYDYDC